LNSGFASNHPGDECAVSFFEIPIDEHSGTGIFENRREPRRPNQKDATAFTGIPSNEPNFSKLEEPVCPEKPESVLADLIPEVQLAKQLDVTRKTLRLWRRQRRGPVHTPVGRRIFYRRERVEEWLRSREQTQRRRR
jgi:hypothetical protein